MAQTGEQRRLAGEKMQQPPSPIAPAKRRYDTTPSLAPAARPPMPPDQVIADSDALPQVVKPTIRNDFPESLYERSAAGEPMTKPRALARDAPREVALSGPLITKIEEPARLPNDRIPLYSGTKSHGPKAGYFQEDSALQNARQVFRQHVPEHSPQILAQRMPESSRSDIARQAAKPIMAHNLLGQQDPLIQTPQRTPAPSGPLIQSLQSQAENYVPPSAVHPTHSRNNSLTTIVHSALDPSDLSSLRRVPSHRPLFNNNMAGSPALAPTTPVPLFHLGRAEIVHPSPVAPAAEAPKPPVKRSNVFGLLNDDPPEPPPKRPLLETPKRATVLSPRLSTLTQAQNPLQQSRSQHQVEESMGGRTMRGFYGHSNIMSAAGGQPPSTDFSATFVTPPVTGPSNKTWMDQFDPRPQDTPAEHRAHRHSPAPSQYSVVPPGSQPPLMHGMRAETTRSLERPNMDHRRALLGQMNQLPHNPSPPPQQVAPPLRSASSSSQHSRIPSLGYPGSQQPSQSSSLAHPPAPQTYPQSANSTPVSSLHHRAQSSLDSFGSKPLTIQQHMAQQTQQKQQEQQREHDRHLQRQREIEVTSQREREWEHQQAQQQQQQQQHNMRRDIYGIESQVSYLHQRQPATQPGQMPPHLQPSARPAHYRGLSRGEERR